MALSLSGLSWWMWSGKEKDSVLGGSTLSSSSGSREPEALKLASSSRKVKRKWQSREERRIDREYDVVLVPSDGVGLTGSESDDSDWSIGWYEPHGPNFRIDDDESNDSFAVLVPCYRPGCAAEESNVELLSAIKNLPNQFAAEGKSYMDQWLSTLEKVWILNTAE